MVLLAECLGLHLSGPRSSQPTARRGDEPHLPLEQHLPPLTAPAPESAPTLCPKSSYSDRKQLFMCLFNELIRHVLRRFLPSPVTLSAFAVRGCVHGGGSGRGLGDLQSLSRSACGQAGGKAARPWHGGRIWKLRWWQQPALNTKDSYRPSNCCCV